MRLFEKAKDGGPDSPVDGYFLIEIKSLFSVVLLHFNKGARESFHTHAFNALTFWLKGHTYEVKTDNTVRLWEAGSWKYTPRNLMHRFITTKTEAWALSFRGPWDKTWREYNPATGEFTTLSSGREIVTYR